MSGFPLLRTRAALTRRHVLALWSGIPAILLTTSEIGFAQTRKYRIGWLSPADRAGPNHGAFLEQLEKLGFFENKNFTMIWKWGKQDYGALSSLAAQLVQEKPDIIVSQTQAATLAAKKATSGIPIVFVGVRDPVVAGIVTQLNRPGGNITGVTLTPSAELAAKQVELLKDVVNSLNTVGIFWNPSVQIQAQVVDRIKGAAANLGIDIRSLPVQTVEEIKQAFGRIRAEGIQGLITLVESFTLQNRVLIAELALEYRVPTIFEVRDYVDAGGLLSYGVQYHSHYAQAAVYVAKILNGTAAGDLPIEQPTRFDCVLNLKTANLLGIEVPAAVLVRTTEIIE